MQQVSCPIYWISTLTLHSVTGWMIFVSLLSMKDFFLGEFIHSILHRKGKKKKKGAQFPNQFLIAR